MQPISRLAGAQGPAGCQRALPAKLLCSPNASGALPNRRAALEQLASSVLLLGAAVGGSGLLLPPPPAAAATAEQTAATVAAACVGCVAAVSAIGGGAAAAAGEQQCGSGIIWDSQGHVVVPYSPLTRVQRQNQQQGVQVLVSLTAADGSRHQLPAEVVAKDPSRELAVLLVAPPPGGLRPVPIGTSADLRVGQDAVLLGALPGSGSGGAASVAAGVISATGRVIPAANNQAIAGVLQTDADVTQQSLGGALLDSSGRLVGMPVVTYAKPGAARSSGVNFALPVDLLREVVPKLIVYGSASARR